MLQFKHYINLSKNILNCYYKQRYFSRNSIKYQITKLNFKNESKQRKIDPYGLFLLIVPATTFALGIWQIRRKEWKENLIAELEIRTNAKPISLPEDLNELRDLAYHPVYVRGHFLHDKELYMGPRSLLKNGDAAANSGLLSNRQNTNTGYLVVTPFKLADRDLTILVNRGWVSPKNRDPRNRKSGQISGEVDLVGLVRLQEVRPNFVPNNNPETNLWFYRDLETMAEITGAGPIFLDAISDFDVTGGPIGGQTRVSLRNDHLSYIITWFSLSSLTSLMWYRQFILKVRPM